MEDLVQREHEIMKVCLLAGQIMLQSGAETYRVEDTMVRIAASFGVDKTHSYMTLRDSFFYGGSAADHEAEPNFGPDDEFA